MPPRNTLQDLRRILAEPKTESFASTGKVMVAPSGVTRELAQQAIEAMDLTEILGEIGAVVGAKIASDLEAMSLRPADYAVLPDMSLAVAKRLGTQIAKAPTEFTAALMDRLRLRG